MLAKRSRIEAVKAASYHDLSKSPIIQFNRSQPNLLHLAKSSDNIIVSGSSKSSFSVNHSLKGLMLKDDHSI